MHNIRLVLSGLSTYDLELKYISPHSRLAKSFGSMPPPEKSRKEHFHCNQAHKAEQKIELKESLF